MAPRPMPVRSQQSRTIQQQISQGAYSKENPQGKISVFNDLKKAGLIPQEFQDAKHLADVISVELEKGKSVKEVLAELKVKLGSGKFDKQGNIVGRQIRNMLNPVLAEAWDKSNAGLTAEQLAKLQRKDWSYKVNELKEWARRLGIKQDVGHFDTSAGGAPQDVSAAGGENADANQAAGRSIENPPRPADKYLKQNVGISSNPVEGLSETAIRAMGEKTRGGTRYPLHPLVSNLLGTTLYGQTSNLLEGVKGGIEQFNRQFEALVDQKLNPIAMYDYVKSLPEGKAINIKEMAKAGLEDYDLSKYHPEVLKAEQAALGASPVRTYQMPKGPTVTTQGVPKGLQVVLTPSQSRGQIATAIANREPVKPPKPVVVLPTPVKPKPKPKPKISAKPSATPTARLSIRGPAVPKPAKKSAASSLQKITEAALTDVIRIVPGQGLPGFEGV